MTLNTQFTTPESKWQAVLNRDRTSLDFVS